MHQMRGPAADYLVSLLPAAARPSHFRTTKLLKTADIAF